MSIEYILYNKPLSKKDIMEQTNFKIEHHNDSDWIVANKNCNIRIKSGDDENIYELENHSFKDVNIILDTFISKFNITFYTDNELENYFQLQHNYTPETFPYPEYLNSEGKFDFKQAVVRDMMYFGGYDVLDVTKGIVIIPDRII